MTYYVASFNRVGEFLTNFPGIDLNTNFFQSCFGSLYSIGNINHNDAFIFAYDQTNEVVGFLTVDDKNKSINDYMFIWNVCIRPQNRGQRITKLLFNHLIEKYFQSHQKFCLTVEWGNSIAVKSYTSEFFCDWGIRNGEFLMYGEIGNRCSCETRQVIQNDFEKLSKWIHKKTLTKQDVSLLTNGFEANQYGNTLLKISPNLELLVLKKL
jgi:hypothetical protein